MELITTSSKNLNTDIWGFPYVWVPFGKPGVINDTSGDYEVKTEEIFNPESLKTLSAIPVYEMHPWSTVVTFDNKGSDSREVGVTTDKYRLTEDGGGEVLVKITDKNVIGDIYSNILVETSPCYSVINGVRVYNHIALLTVNKAKGGNKMRIRVEGETTYLPQEVYIINNKEIMEQIERMLAEILTSNTVTASRLDSIESKLSAASTVEELTETQIYSEGFSAGEAAGITIAEATGFGYVKSEGTDTLVEARKFVICKAFPDLDIAGYSTSMLEGLYKGAVSALKQLTKSESKPNTPDDTVPVIKTTENTKKVSRLKLQ
jgi:hypothetical protein